MPAPNPHPDEPAAPAGLADALRAAYGRGPGVPAEVDQAILDRARRQFAARARFRPWLIGIRLGAGLAAAAGLALAAWLILPRTAAPSTRTALALRGDADGDGRVDIVDALRVARSIGHTSTVAPAWDANADGRLDQRDVDAIASTAVRLDGGAM
jgi:hypothetical protein